jgi:hypothetical protein
MAENPNKAVSAVGVVTAVAAVILGRFLGWMFGLKLVVPLIVGVVAYDAFRKKLKPEAQPYTPALAITAAYLSWVLLDILIQVLGGHFWFNLVTVILLLIVVVGFIALIVQPGVPPALLLTLRHGYSLLMTLRTLPLLFSSEYPLARHAVFDLIVSLGFSVASIVLLLRGMLKKT